MISRASRDRFRRSLAVVVYSIYIHVYYSLHPKLSVILRILESQSILSLTKIIKRIIKIYDIKEAYMKL